MFDFGKNWEEYSQGALNENLVSQAQVDFAELFDGLSLEGKTFLDIGFGQGLSLLCAAELGAKVVGCDIHPTCVPVLRSNARLFPNVAGGDIPVVVGSILDGKTSEKLRTLNDGGFDIVHSWGVLHHTGDLRRALRVAIDLVIPEGYLVVAVYNRHWSSPVWRWIKQLYCRLPQAGKRVMIALFYPIIWTAKLAVTRKDPTRKERGMDFYYDVVDWVGGYPYEYASVAEMQAQTGELGLECVRHLPPSVPTGCNEFVFKKT